MKSLHSHTQGSGPVVILLHGFLASGEYWRSLASHLSRQYQVITIDLLGFGHSPKPRQSMYDVDEHLTWLYATIKARLEPDQKFILVGHSMGALIAALYAAEHGSDVQKLIAVNPPIFANKQQAQQAIKRTNIFYRLFLYSPLGRAGRPLLYIIARLAAMFSLLRLKNVAQIARGFRWSTHRSRRRSLEHIIEAQAFLDIIHAVEVPLIILAGKKDRALYLKNLDAATLPKHASLKIIEGGHHLPLQHPDVVRQAIESAL